MYNITMETKPTLPAYMTSSVDPAKVSSRVSGVVLASSSIIIFFAAQFFKIELTADDIIGLATQIGAVAGAIVTVKGIIIWIMTKFGKKVSETVTPVVNIPVGHVVSGNE